VKNKLISFCKKQRIDENEAIKLIQKSLKGYGYTKTKWKIERFGFYADLRKKHDGAPTIYLVKVIVEMPEYEERFKFFYPHLEFNKQNEARNLTKLLADPRQIETLHRVFKLKGFDLIKPTMKDLNFRPKHLLERQACESNRN